MANAEDKLGDGGDREICRFDEFALPQPLLRAIEVFLAVTNLGRSVGRPLVTHTDITVATSSLDPGSSTEAGVFTQCPW